jgi:hypothetical protein
VREIVGNDAQKRWLTRVSAAVLNREEFIEQEMRRRKQQMDRAGKSDSTDSAVGASAAPGASSQPEAASEYAPAEAKDPNAMKIVGERRVAGPRWGMGVVEVELPEEYRMRNIEETKQKLKEMSSKPKSGLSEFVAAAVALARPPSLLNKLNRITGTL